MNETIITSSVLILIIIILRYLLRGKISSRLQYALWALVAIRLLLPFSLFESPVSVMNAVPDTQSYSFAVEQHKDLSDSKGNDIVVNRNDSPVPSNGYGTPDRTDRMPDVKGIVSVVWLAGSLGAGVFFFAANIRLSRELKQRRKRMEVSGYPLPVYMADNLPSPCLHGILRPVVYLTSECTLDQKRMAHVMAHELTHYRHRDPIWSFVRILCLCIHWFNPLVWFAALLSRRDSELACDEGTLLALGEESRVEYGKTIIEMTTAPWKPSNLFCCTTTMTGGKGEMTERIKRIAKKPKTLLITIAIVIVAATGAIALTFGGAANKVPVLLPQINQVTEITIDQISGGESRGAISISRNEDIELLLDALSDTDKTLRESVNDTPNADSYFQIEMKSAESRRFFLYHDGGNYYMEEPYAGIYRTKSKTDAVVEKFYLAGQEVDSEGNVNGLWNARTPYVGDNSAIGKLLGLLPLPEGLKQDHFALRTTGEERGLEWILKGDDTASYEGNSIYLDALLLFTLVDNLQDLYVTMEDTEGEETSFHYDRIWADETAGCDVRDYGESPEKLQELLELFGTENAFAQYNVARLGKNGEILDGYFLADRQLALDIISDYMVKSAAWEGVDITTLEECYLIRQIFPEANETHDYYAYLKEDGTAVLQSGTDGWYSVLSSELYSELVKSMELLTEDSWIENKYTEGVPRPEFDTMLWMAPDEENGYCAVCYEKVDKAQIEQYIQVLKENGWKTIRDVKKHKTLGGLYEKDSHSVSLQFAGEQLVLYFSLK